MAEVNTAEAEQKVEAAFSGTPPVETVKVVNEPVAVEPPVVAPAPAPEKPRYAKVLQSDYDNLRAVAGKVPSLESAVVKLTNAVGNTAQLEQRIFEKVQSQTPAGLNVEMSDEDFAELAADFPELAKHTRATLERVLKKAGVRGTGTAPTPQLRDEDVEKGVERALQKREAAALVRAYSNWATIVGQVDMSKGEKPDPNNEFRLWLDQQPAAYQKEIADTDSPAEVRSAIDKFMASKTAPATQVKPDRAAARRAVMEDAVTPRADGSPPMLHQPMTAEEAFRSVKPIRPH